MQTEIWKDVVGYEGFYQVSNFGGVRGVDRRYIGPSGRRNWKKGQLLKPNASKKGYLTVSLVKGESHKKITVHRLVAIVFIENPLHKETVNHKDLNKKNNYFDNLEWATNQENTAHSFTMGRQAPKGEHNGQSVLNIDKVLEIRIKILTHTRRSLAKEFGVSMQTISDIKNRKAWKHI